MKILMIILHFLHKLAEFVLDWIVEFIDGIGKDIAQKAIVPLLVKILPSLVGVWLAGEAVHQVGSGISHFISPSPKESPAQVLMADSSAFKQVSADLAIAQEDNRNLREMTDVYQFTIDQLKNRDPRDKSAFDSLQKQFQNLVEVVRSSGKGAVTGAAAKKDTTYQDPWLTAFLKGDSLHYIFAFELDDVTLTLENNAGEERNIFSVFLRSLRDTTQKRYLGDIVKKIDRVPAVPEDLSLMWIDPTLSGGVFFGPEMTFGLGYSPFMISSGGMQPKAVIVRYPFITISSNFKNSTPVAVGIAINAAHWLPLIKDTYISPNFGYDLKAKGTVILLGLSTTL